MLCESKNKRQRSQLSIENQFSTTNKNCNKQITWGYTMFNNSLFNKSKLLLATGLLTMAGAANAGYTFNLSDDDKLTFGGFIKVDTRYTSGDAAYRDFWIGTAGVADDQSMVKILANETRFNTKYEHGDVTGFIEMDFYGGQGTGEAYTNGLNPRLRHAFIKYKNVTVGQTWTTFMNTSALAETADFGGPMVGEAFIRNAQIRYSVGNFDVSLENPETTGGDASNDSLPDVVAKYTFKGDWGNVSVAGLFRQLSVDADDNETALGYSVAGRFNVAGKDDIRFQLHGGNTGRYVGVAAASDLVNGKAEDSIGYMAAYRHFWNDDTRSSIFYGNITTDLSDVDRTHWGVNVFTNITKQLSYGIELGQFDMDDKDASSVYGQFSVKYVL